MTQLITTKPARVNRPMIWRTHTIIHIRGRALLMLAALAAGACLWNGGAMLIEPDGEHKAWALTFAGAAVVLAVSALLSLAASARRVQRITLSENGVAFGFPNWSDDEVAFYHAIGRIRVVRIWLTVFFDCADVVLLTTDGPVRFARVRDPYGLLEEIQRRHHEEHD